MPPSACRLLATGSPRHHRRRDGDLDWLRATHRRARDYQGFGDFIFDRASYEHAVCEAVYSIRR